MRPGRRLSSGHRGVEAPTAAEISGPPSRKVTEGVGRDAEMIEEGAASITNRRRAAAHQIFEQSLQFKIGIELLLSGNFVGPARKFYHVATPFRRGGHQHVGQTDSVSATSKAPLQAFSDV